MPGRGWAPGAVAAVISCRFSTRCRRPLTPSKLGASFRACTSRSLPTRRGRMPCFGLPPCTPASRSPSSTRRDLGCPRARCILLCGHGGLAIANPVCPYSPHLSLIAAMDSEASMCPPSAIHGDRSRTCGAEGKISNSSHYDTFISKIGQ